MPRFERLGDEPLILHAGEPLASMFTLSPFVLGNGDGFDVLLRAVNRADDPRDKVARVYHGTSGDGLHFTMDPDPAIAPGPQHDDRDGCEDPTVATVDGERFVYYSGWNQEAETGELLLARGSSFDRLHKAGVALASMPEMKNPKEATIAGSGDGWLLYFEYARAGASRIGLAQSVDVHGPWRVGSIDFEPRPERFDAWHLSPGAIVQSGQDRIFFYNGATKKTNWRIGWARLDESGSGILDRCDEPIFEPPPPQEESTDIAFSASALQRNGEIWLYYSLADKEMRRARLRDTTAMQ